jgi:hypothetical protein
VKANGLNLARVTQFQIMHLLGGQGLSNKQYTKMYTDMEKLVNGFTSHMFYCQFILGKIAWASV